MNDTISTMSNFHENLYGKHVCNWATPTVAAPPHTHTINIGFPKNPVRCWHQTDHTQLLSQAPALYASTRVMLTTVHAWIHFVDRETEARGSWVTCPSLHNLWMMFLCLVYTQFRGLDPVPESGCISASPKMFPYPEGKAEKWVKSLAPGI